MSSSSRLTAGLSETARLMADFELLALFLEESLVFAVCHVRTIDLNVNEVRGALDAQAPAYFIVDRPFTLAQGLRNSRL